MHDDDEQIEKTEEQARQGVTLHAMRYVLGFGIAGAAIALLVVMAVIGA